MKDRWEVMSRVFTQELTRNFRMARSTFEVMRCSRTSRGVGYITPHHVTCNGEKNVSVAKCQIVLFTKYAFFGIAQKTTSCKHKKLFCGVYFVVRNLCVFVGSIFSFRNVNVKSTRFTSESAMLDYKNLPVAPVVL